MLTYTRLLVLAGALWTIAPSAGIAETITGYPAASALDGTEVYPCNQGTATKKCTVAQTGATSGLYASLDAAVTAIGSTPTTLTINTTLPVVGNVTVPSTLTLKFETPGKLTVPDTKLVTVNGDIVAPWNQVIFSLTGSGNVYVANGKPIVTAWYNSDLTTAVAAVQASAPGTPASIASYVGIHIWIPNGTYSSSTCPVFYRNEMQVTFDAGVIIYAAAGQKGLCFDGSGNSDTFMRRVVVNMNGRVESVGTRNSGDLVYINGVTISKFFFNRISDSGANGITLKEFCWGNNISFNSITDTVGWGIGTDNSGGTTIINDNYIRGGTIEHTDGGGIQALRWSQNVIEAVIENLDIANSVGLLLDSARDNMLRIHFESGATIYDIKTAATVSDCFGNIINGSSFGTTNKTAPRYNIDLTNGTNRTFEIRSIVSILPTTRFLNAGTSSLGATVTHDVLLGSQVGRAGSGMDITAAIITDSTETGIRYALPLMANFTWDPGSLNDGDGETKDVTVPGALLGKGWRAEVAAPYDLQGITCTAYIKTTNTVSVRCQNESTGTIDLASGTWKAKVRRD